MAAHVLGIAGSDNQGLEGIEYYYDAILRGIPGRLTAERDASQRSIPGGTLQSIPAQAGQDVILTLDSVIQYNAELVLQDAVLSSKSDRGLVLIMDPRTGEIIANAIFPTFDPNDYQKVPLEQRRNVAITDQYEPGSTFKFVTAAASLDLNLTHNARTFESGLYWEIGGGGVFVIPMAGPAGVLHSWKRWNDPITLSLPSWRTKWARSVFILISGTSVSGSA